MSNKFAFFKKEYGINLSAASSLRTAGKDAKAPAADKITKQSTPKKGGRRASVATPTKGGKNGAVKGKAVKEDVEEDDDEVVKSPKDEGLDEDETELEATA